MVAFERALVIYFSLSSQRLHPGPVCEQDCSLQEQGRSTRGRAWQGGVQKTELQVIKMDS